MTRQITALARRIAGFFAECNYAQRRLTILRTAPDAYLTTRNTAPDDYSDCRQPRLRRPGRSSPARSPAHEYSAYEYRASMSAAKSLSSTLRRIPSLTVSCPASWVKSVSRIRNFLMDSALDTA